MLFKPRSLINWSQILILTLKTQFMQHCVKYVRVCGCVFGWGSSRFFWKIFCCRKNFLFSDITYCTTTARGAEYSWMSTLLTFLYNTSCAWPTAADQSLSAWMDSLRFVALEETFVLWSCPVNVYLNVALSNKIYKLVSLESKKANLSKNYIKTYWSSLLHVFQSQQILNKSNLYYKSST